MNFLSANGAGRVSPCHHFSLSPHSAPAPLHTFYAAFDLICRARETHIFICPPVPLCWQPMRLHLLAYDAATACLSPKRVFARSRSS